ncbi:helix-turn-helix domain-containing protein [Nocardioides sp. TRM66260-LWL]|uniref:PucR family transcriptional regulator n=1 Tax=Nocardioides sp. TRM66260-LWL TaxID=2874478 RepID=UPI001CC3B54A|nr:helix-turn-helix domain-containing protein [Nocardioides sp. TRM66260-LWL]MBZ5735105.1 helix-turn-helix domain-containing protein [Nocardioides sp. TRM66260-LWL]
MTASPPRSDGRARPTDPRVVAACRRVLDDLDGLTARVCAQIRDAEAVYRTAVTPEQLAESVRPNLVGIVQSLISEDGTPLAPPRHTGRVRAAQGVPLPPVLHAYRLGVLSVWNELVELCGPDPDAARALLASGERLWTALDLYSQELAAAYREVEVEQLRRDARLRESALTAVLTGAPPQGRTLAEMADVLGLPLGGPFAVIAADHAEADPGADGGAGSGPTPESVLAGLGVRSAWRTEADGDLGLATLAPGARGTLAAALVALGDVPLAGRRVGVSRVHPTLADVPAGVTEARLARDAAAPGRVTAYDDARVAGLLLGAPTLADDLRADLAGALAPLPAGEAERLLETFVAWFDADGSAERAGAALHCHANTVRYRLSKLATLTGRDLRRPADVVHLHLAAEAHRLRADAGAA